jgi:hypothetical protein
VRRNCGGQAAIVLYAQLAASQPYKGQLLQCVLDSLVHIVANGVGGEVEAALTCLGNLASHAPNTVAMVDQVRENKCFAVLIPL